jgi:5-methylcytosine-specific restriction endonuclease McrBC regulatory subunit McrC
MRPTPIRSDNPLQLGLKGPRRLLGIYNFLKAERPDLVIGRERFHWRAKSESKASLDLLPVMETDVSIYTGGKHIILDTKFYRQTFGGASA